MMTRAAYLQALSDLKTVSVVALAVPMDDFIATNEAATKAGPVQLPSFWPGEQATAGATLAYELTLAQAAKAFQTALAKIPKGP